MRPLALCRTIAIPELSARICCRDICSSSSFSAKKDSDQGDEKGVSKRSAPSGPPRRTQRPRNRKRIAHTWFKPDAVNVGAPWSSVWQGPKSFDPHMIPFPVRMGRPLKGELPPPSLGNLELMKIPNFFHLTPPAITKHCEALKPLCTPWPKKLPFMPLRIETRNYVFPGHSVKHSGSKQVTINFQVSDLGLSARARSKMIQLAGKRYKAETDTMRIHTGRCPTRVQNMDYAMYILKVLYLESNKVEPWEEEQEFELGDT